MEYESPNEVIKRVGIYLSVAMPTGKARLTEHLIGLEACRFDLARAATQWQQTLSEYKNRMLYPKDKDKTELDRNVMLDAHVAIVRKDYELLCRLEELIKDRLEFGSLLLTLQ